ncbi:MAG: hypothetical protein OZ928_06595 [Polyangiaceae bacterium]|nr:hypothetical protein [Polyangiaceae bacterium]
MSDAPPRCDSTHCSSSDDEQLALTAPTRVVDAWLSWLGALATDAEAALAAAIAYAELEADARDQWLAALERDACRVSAPRIAVYAPLLAVEADPARRERITAAMGPADAAARLRVGASALGGLAADGTRVATVITPLYLDFVQVLACGYRNGAGFSWVKHDPIVDRRAAPRAGDVIGGATLERTPLKPLVDDLAQAVLAHQRAGKAIPEALRIFADLFGPVIDEQAGELTAPR